MSATPIIIFTKPTQPVSVRYRVGDVVRLSVEVISGTGYTGDKVLWFDKSKTIRWQGVQGQNTVSPERTSLTSSLVNTGFNLQLQPNTADYKEYYAVVGWTWDYLRDYLLSLQRFYYPWMTGGTQSLPETVFDLLKEQNRSSWISEIFTVSSYYVAPIAITTQPVAGKVKAGASFTLSVVASNVDDYQWYRGGVAIAGATDSTYVIANVAGVDFADYYVKLSNHSGTLNSATVTLDDVAPHIPPSVLLSATALGFDKGEVVTIPVFSNSTVEDWNCTALPDGLEFDKELGRIAGTATLTGVWVVGITAINTYGTNTNYLTIEIAEATAGISTGIDLAVDVETKAVQLLGQPPVASAGAVFAVKGKDDVLLFVRFLKRGLTVDLEVTSLIFIIKEDAESASLVVSSDFSRQHDALGDFFVLRFSPDSPAIDALFTNYEGPVRTEFQAVAELSWRVVSPWSGVGPRTYTNSSRIFPISVIRDLGQL